MNFKYHLNKIKFELVLKEHYGLIEGLKNIIFTIMTTHTNFPT